MANKWPIQSPVAMNAFYGRPGDANSGVADPAWERANIVSIVPPYQLYYPKADAKGRITDKRGTRWKALRVHKKCSASLLRILTRIGQEFSADELRKYELDICGGTFVFRKMRGGNSLSIHSWASAIDISHLINGLGKKWSAAGGMMPERAVRAFEDEGWTWGGKWSRPDGMHFQAADVKGQARTTKAAVLASVTPTPPVAKPEPEEPAAAEIEEPAADTRPAPEEPAEPVVDPEIEANKKIQTRLRELKYFEVGAVDGEFGPSALAAVREFRKQNDLPEGDEIDEEFKARLFRPDAKPKPVAAARANSTPTEAATKSDTVAATWRSKIVGFFGMIVAGIASAFTAILEFFKETWESVAGIREFLSGVPGWVWVAGVLAVAVGYWWVTHSADQKAVDAYRTGELR